MSAPLHELKCPKGNSTKRACKIIHLRRLSYPSKKLKSTDNQVNLPELNSLMYKHLSSTPTKALLLQNLTRVSDRSIPIIHI